jgi:hypothetical protein
LFPKIDQLVKFIEKDYQADTQKMYTNEEIMKAIDQDINGSPGLKPFILDRRENVLLQLDSLKITTNNHDQMNIIQPKFLQIYPNYPNPFNPITTINYELGFTNYIELSIYNLLGQKVATLISEKQNAGYHQIVWNAKNLPSGIYYAVIKAGEFQFVNKMLLSK